MKWFPKKENPWCAIEWLAIGCAASIIVGVSLRLYMAFFPAQQIDNDPREREIENVIGLSLEQPENGNLDEVEMQIVWPATAGSPEFVGRWEKIVIHHSGSPHSTIEGIKTWHVDHNKWRAIGYHFIVQPSGKIYVSERWRHQWDGAHCRGHNRNGIGICLIGDFENLRPADAQVTAAAALVEFLQQLCKIDPSHIYNHSDLAKTLCPGKHLKEKGVATWQSKSESDSSASKDLAR